MRYLFLLYIYLMPLYAFGEKRIAVLEFRTISAEDTLVDILSDVVRKGVLDATKGHKVAGEDILVFTKENMMDMLNQMGKTAEDCQGECEVELARNIGADYVISGEIAKLGELFILTLKIHETNKGILLDSHIIKENKIEDVIEEAENKSRLLTISGLEIRSGIEQEKVVVTGQEKINYTSWSANDASKESAIKFISNPKGASVYLNGEFLCSETPCSKYIPSGSHQVIFRKQRYEDNVEELSTDLQKEITSTLEPLFGRVSIKSSISGVDILVDNESWGSTPLEKEVDPGIYTLSINDPCFHPTSYRLQVKKNKSVEAVIDLVERKGGVKVYAFTKGDAVSASIFVDGHKVGMTAEALTLPLCTGQIEVKGDFGTYKHELRLKEEEIVTLNLDLNTVRKEDSKDEASPEDTGF